jgi:hypothetical protein
MTSFCAICTDEAGPFDVLELDGRTYVACQKCLSEHPQRGGHVDWNRGYEVPRDVLTIAEFKRAVETFRRNVKAPPLQCDRSPSHYGLRPGEELYRVAIKQDGKPIDADDAIRILNAADPSASVSAYRGTANGYHVIAIRRSA